MGKESDWRVTRIERPILTPDLLKECTALDVVTLYGLMVLCGEERIDNLAVTRIWHSDTPGVQDIHILHGAEAVVNVSEVKMKPGKDMAKPSLRVTYSVGGEKERVEVIFGDKGRCVTAKSEPGESGKKLSVLHVFPSGKSDNLANVPSRLKPGGIMLVPSSLGLTDNERRCQVVQWYWWGE